MKFLEKLLSRGGGRRYRKQVAAINAMEQELTRLDDHEISARARSMRDEVAAGRTLDSLTVEAYALGREAARRTLGMRPYDVQLLGGLALYDGCIAEMKTGEGKTLVATLPSFLHALSGRGVHVVTVNDYLAARDAEWMGPMYEMLGLTVGVVLEEMEADDDEEEFALRRAAYGSDITYATNHEVAFDYLRDNLATSTDEIVHRGFNYAIVDEVDFLLIDEARTPLIISGPGREDLGAVRRVEGVVRRLKRDVDYVADAKSRTASLTESGYSLVAERLGVPNLTDADHVELFRLVRQAVIAHAVYERDVDYVVEGKEVHIVDEFTGRVSPDKRYADGLHQAIEAKERVPVRAEDQTIAKVTYQTFFARYQRLAGMTGTASDAREEFGQVYKRRVFEVPTNRPCIREDYADVVFESRQDKFRAVVEEVRERTETGQPVLIGTTSTKESELLSRMLKKKRVPHKVLNAKNHANEARIIAEAGRRGAVTVSTNMAGRGTDIVLGGTANDDDDARQREAAEVREAGGLHVLGTGRHESIRIDQQLRGRAGRQGDPGSSQFFLSLDDPLYEKFGASEIEAIQDRLEEIEHEPGTPIGSRTVRQVLRELQKKVEIENEAVRRDVLKYDLVIHGQREALYEWRRGLVTSDRFEPEAIVTALVDTLVSRSARAVLPTVFKAHFHAELELSPGEDADTYGPFLEQALAAVTRRREVVGESGFQEYGRRLLLEAIDDVWTDHLSNLERIEEGMDLWGYAEIDPVVAWRKEATRMWEESMHLIRSRFVTLWLLPGRAA